jgi:peptidoglycan/xylan/chitin deacetylase (PgdA/CDA1 family)
MMRSTTMRDTLRADVRADVRSDARGRGRTPLGRQLRTAAKAGIATGLDRSGIGRLIGAWRGRIGEPLVVGYHRVVEDFDRFDSTSMSPMLTSASTFEQHLDWIGSRYRFVSLDELAALLESGAPASKPVAAVTFDDGYQDVFQNAMPILVRKGIPFAVFVVTDLVGTDGLQIHDELYLLLSGVLARPAEHRQALWQAVVGEFTDDAATRLRLLLTLENASGPFEATRGVLDALEQPEIRPFTEALGSKSCIPDPSRQGLQSLNWDMLRDMTARGVTVGSHTKSHALLDNGDPERIRSELEESRQALEWRLGTAVRHFAYPDGRFDRETLRAVAAAGYRTAYTTCRHRDPGHPLLTIPRKMLWEKACSMPSGRFSSAILSCQVNGIFDAGDKCRLQHDAHSDHLE